LSQNNPQKSNEQGQGRCPQVKIIGERNHRINGNRNNDVRLDVPPGYYFNFFGRCIDEAGKLQDFAMVVKRFNRHPAARVATGIFMAIAFVDQFFWRDDQAKDNQEQPANMS